MRIQAGWTAGTYPLWDSNSCILPLLFSCYSISLEHEGNKNFSFFTNLESFCFISLVREKCKICWCAYEFFLLCVGKSFSLRKKKRRQVRNSTCLRSKYKCVIWVSYLKYFFANFPLAYFTM